MSNCVVRMEIPQNCLVCPNGHPDWIYNDNGAAQMVCFCNICNTEEDDRWISETEIVRPSWCPIICQLPEGHGRLVDADALKAWFFRPYSNEESYCNMDVAKAIDKAPTIVPAERSET